MDFSNLKREMQLMPPDVEQRLIAENLMDAYHARPAYQQNDYLGWLARAKRPETRIKRLEQMIMELHSGHLYMRMIYRGNGV